MTARKARAAETQRLVAAYLAGRGQAGRRGGERLVTTDETFDEWAILELMGHRRLAGRVREVQLAGAGFLRLDIPATEGHGTQTQYISPGSVYALHPTTEEIATAAAANFRPAPVSRWELESKRPTADDVDAAVEWATDDGDDVAEELPAWERELLEGTRRRSEEGGVE